MVSFFRFIVTVSVFAISANAALVDEDHRTLGKSVPNPIGKGSKMKESSKSTKAPKGTKSPKMNGGKKGDPCGPTPLCRIDFVSETGMQMIASADAAAAAATEHVDARGAPIPIPIPIFGDTCNPCGPNGFMTNPGGILIDLALPDIPGLDLPDAIEVSCGCANVLGNLPVFDEESCAFLVDAVASAEVCACVPMPMMT
ncbi:hypothetical protein IV203_028113 [Nitzschia inconspicua]|uniref:Uncharacterized protein n=1 Tax=Nitzschia inconspicua TaxID=303405 RepID=A0A9K3LXY0_9STRA|nr:hypothetical protein IV203_028113 [Nitzschia inconspicua]